MKMVLCPVKAPSEDGHIKLSYNVMSLILFAPSFLLQLTSSSWEVKARALYVECPCVDYSHVLLHSIQLQEFYTEDTTSIAFLYTLDNSLSTDHG